MFILSMSLISKVFAPDSIFGRDRPTLHPLVSEPDYEKGRKSKATRFFG